MNLLFCGQSILINNWSFSQRAKSERERESVREVRPLPETGRHQTPATTDREHISGQTHTHNKETNLYTQTKTETIQHQREGGVGVYVDVHLI